METVTDFLFLGSKITADGDCSHEIKRQLLLGRKTMTNLDSILKSRVITLPTKVCLVKAMVSPVVMYGCESWTVKESWAQNNWCFWTVVLEKTLESPLDCKEIQPVNPKGNQSWIFIGRTDAKADTPILWPSARHIRWPKYSASAPDVPMNIQNWFPLGWTGWISLQSKGLSRVFSDTTVQKHQFFGAQPSLWSNSHIHTWLLEKSQLWLYEPLSLLFNMLSGFVIAFLPRSMRLLISWLQSPSAVILKLKKIKSVTAFTVSPSICHNAMGLDAMILVSECWVSSQLFNPWVGKIPLRSKCNSL